MAWSCLLPCGFLAYRAHVAKYGKYHDENLVQCFIDFVASPRSTRNQAPSEVYHSLISCDSACPFLSPVAVEQALHERDPAPSVVF
ncbi:hypothetical protein BDW22DRAFT_1359491 [Trametopsis cervina]|nr:hypothetical protein BDW22DRAFT_1359491 [Trametopsis cervina]